MRQRACPRCWNFDTHPSRRRGFAEWWILALVMLRPFRCHYCFYRFYRFVV
ncbi:MAG TPA: hypothetical protein VL523_15415 [Terriglobia bacterium]|nr:hypothetical protein [Terriglobia bacterium]